MTRWGIFLLGIFLFCAVPAPAKEGIYSRILFGKLTGTKLTLKLPEGVLHSTDNCAIKNQRTFQRLIASDSSVANPTQFGSYLGKEFVVFSSSLGKRVATLKGCHQEESWGGLVAVLDFELVEKNIASEQENVFGFAESFGHDFVFRSATKGELGPQLAQAIIEKANEVLVQRQWWKRERLWWLGCRSSDTKKDRENVRIEVDPTVFESGRSQKPFSFALDFCRGTKSTPFRYAPSLFNRLLRRQKESPTAKDMESEEIGRFLQSNLVKIAKEKGLYIGSECAKWNENAVDRMESRQTVLYKEDTGGSGKKEEISVAADKLVERILFCTTYVETAQPPTYEVRIESSFKMQSAKKGNVEAVVVVTWKAPDQKEAHIREIFFLTGFESKVNSLRVMTTADVGIGGYFSHPLGFIDLDKDGTEEIIISYYEDEDSFPFDILKWDQSSLSYRPMR